MLVFVGLEFDAGQSRPGLLCLKDSSGLPIDVEQIVCESMAGLEREVSEHDTGVRMYVRFVHITNMPSGPLKHAVDYFACFFLRFLSHARPWLCRWFSSLYISDVP